MNNQGKCQLGDDAMNYFTFLCCWLQKTVIVTLWHPHACAHAAIVDKEDMTMYLEQSSAGFNALPEVSHHSTALSGSHSLAH